jgi:hypothetical protein
MSAGERIRESFPGQRFQVYTCLAEGADRLLARVLKKSLAADLIAVLPLPEQEYLKDFLTTESVEEFENIKRLVTNVITLEQEHTLYGAKIPSYFSRRRKRLSITVMNDTS